MTRPLSIVSMLGMALFLMVGKASADIVYGFSGVTFSDGGTLTGSFTTNDAMNALVSYNITTSVTSSPGKTIGTNYTTANSESTPTALPFIIVLDQPSLAMPNNILEVTLNNLTAAGAQITLGTNASFEQSLTDRRDITAGSVVAVPEPSTAVLIGLGGLGLVGYVLRRRRQG